MPSFPHRAVAAACLLAAPATATAAPLYVTITDYRAPVAADVTGTDITVIDADAIARSRADSVASLLKTVPGVGVYETGGAGSQTLVMLRGASPQHTLVLIDGIRVNDPTSTSAQFDFSKINLAEVERIEVLKGPQTALYGSDALGGVINIITKRAGRRPAASLTVEGGSYGTFRTSGSASGSKGPMSIAASASFFTTEGFSRVGDRDLGERDGSSKLTGALTGGYDPGGAFRLDFGLDASRLNSAVDGSSTLDAPGYFWDRDFVSGFARFTNAPAGSRFSQAATLSVVDETARFTEPTLVTDYASRTLAAEYQGEIRPRPSDSLIFGGRIEDQRTSLVSPTTAVASARDLFAAFALYRFDLGRRWHLSAGGRYDAEIGGDGFATGRLTAAYEIAETGTKLRASAANGANRPTAYQLYHPIFGDPALAPERSIGVDWGIEQKLWGARAMISATTFYNRFENLIAFNSAASKYRNIARAETGGVEVGAQAEIVRGVLAASATYTWLHSRNLSDDPAVHGKPLARRAAHTGALTLTYTGIDRLELSASAIFVGARFNDDKAKVPLPAYLRIDLYGAYRLHEHLKAFARIENLFDARYQDAKNYNTAGLSAYGGLTWHR